MFADETQAKVEAVPLTRLQPARWNPRSIKDERFQNLCRSLEQDPGFLWLRPILATADGTVFAGNMRLRAAEHLGWEAVPAILLDIPEQLAKERALKDNGSWGEWEDDDLAALLASLQAEGSDLGLLGFEERQLQQLLDTLSHAPTDADPDNIPDLPDEPVTQPGDLWMLGDHRLLCGDSTDPLTFAQLLGDEPVSCVWTDPPYGVSYVGGTKDKLTIKNDSAEGLGLLLRESFYALDQVLRPGAAIYVAHPAGPNSVLFGQAFVERGWRLHEKLVWVKDRLVLGHSDYHYRHEPILFGYKPVSEGRQGRGGKGWYGGNDADSVFEFPRPQRNEEHPTAKPVGLVAAMVKNSSKSGQIVADAFLGSGSTHIACEQLGRRCYGHRPRPQVRGRGGAAMGAADREGGENGKAPELASAEARLAAMGLGKVTL
ncbi:MAG: DNA methyltransferase [Dehalococcoidia bacterium]